MGLLASLLPRVAHASSGMEEGARLLLLLLAFDFLLVPPTILYVLVAMFQVRARPRPILLGLGVLNGLVSVSAFFLLIGDGAYCVIALLQGVLSALCIYTGRAGRDGRDGRDDPADRGTESAPS